LKAIYGLAVFTKVLARVSEPDLGAHPDANSLRSALRGYHPAALEAFEEWLTTMRLFLLQKGFDTHPATDA
jgi:hypothetical protein